jgi:hypothetical protein
MTDSCDYPAAHSMDTQWFAIDANGNVAVFESGEAGAVPVEGYVGENYFELLEQLQQSGHRSEVIWEVGELQGKHAPTPGNGSATTYVLLLRTLDAISGELEYESAQRIRTSGWKGTGQGVIIDELSAALHKKLHDQDACLGCAWHFEDEEFPNPATYGLFRYEHSCDNWISGPYTLNARPAKPLKASALPPSVAEHCLRVDRPFGELPSINPPEHWQCESWEPGWLASDGKTLHAFEGREHELLKHAEELGPEYVVEGIPPRRAAAKDARETPSTPENGNGTEKKPWWKFW